MGIKNESICNLITLTFLDRKCLLRKGQWDMMHSCQKTMNQRSDTSLIPHQIPPPMNTVNNLTQCVDVVEVYPDLDRY